LGRKFLSLGLFAIVLYLFVTTIPLVLGLVSLKREEARLGIEVLQLRVKQNDLLQRFRPLQAGDTLTMEKLARERVGMTKPGETVYYFPAPESTAETLKAK